MKRRKLLGAAPLAVLVPGRMLQAIELAFARESAGSLASGEKDKGGGMAKSTAVYELRVYHALPGKLESLMARFRDHTMRIFAKHGMKSVAYWTALDEPVKSSTLIYILEHPSRDAATANWKSFQEDPEWKSVKEKSEANGKLVEKIDSTLLTLTDFSPRLG
jgi:NIPSNAP protein